MRRVRDAWLLLACSVAVAMDMSEYPEFQQMMSGELSIGGAENNKQRALFLNTCSFCEAIGHQAGIALAKLAKDRKRGVRTYDATEVLETLCQSNVWNAEYGIAGGQGIGLIGGPGISHAQGANLHKDPNLQEGMTNRARQACVELLSGGDLDEEELYAMAAEELGKKDGSPALTLQAFLCDGADGSCRRYASEYGPGAIHRKSLVKAHDEL